MKKLLVLSVCLLAFTLVYSSEMPIQTGLDSFASTLNAGSTFYIVDSPSSIAGGTELYKYIVPRNSNEAGYTFSIAVTTSTLDFQLHGRDNNDLPTQTGLVFTSKDLTAGSTVYITLDSAVSGGDVFYTYVIPRTTLDMGYDFSIAVTTVKVYFPMSGKMW